MCAGAGRRRRFRKVPEKFRCVLVQVPEAGSGLRRPTPLCSRNDHNILTKTWWIAPQNTLKKQPVTVIPTGSTWKVMEVTEGSVVCCGAGSRGKFRTGPQSSGECWCRFRRQVPDGSAKFRWVLVQVPEAGSGRFRKVLAARQVPEGSGERWCRLRGRFRKVPVSAGAGSGGKLWRQVRKVLTRAYAGSGCRFRRVAESSGRFRRVLVQFLEADSGGRFWRVKFRRAKGQAQVLEGFASLWTKQCTHVQIWNRESQWTWHCCVCAPAVGDTAEA